MGLLAVLKGLGRHVGAVANKNNYTDTGRNGIKSEKLSQERSIPRREVLRKVGVATAFVAPILASFKVADLAVAGSGGEPPVPPD